MKQLKFNMVEVLPSLLNKTKTTTIRRAWKDERDFKATKNKEDILPTIEDYGWGEKPPKYEVGETVEIVFIHKFKRFCRECGEEMYSPTYPQRSNLIMSCMCSAKYPVDPNDVDGSEAKALEKTSWNMRRLGKAKIIKREEIEISKVNGQFSISSIHPDYAMITGNYTWHETEIKRLSKSEGFESIEIMFKKLEEYANGLRTPKKFYLYTFEWVGK